MVLASVGWLETCLLHGAPRCATAWVSTQRGRPRRACRHRLRRDRWRMGTASTLPRGRRTGGGCGVSSWAHSSSARCRPSWRAARASGTTWRSSCFRLWNGMTAAAAQSLRYALASPLLLWRAGSMSACAAWPHGVRHRRCAFAWDLLVFSPRVDEGGLERQWNLGTSDAVVEGQCPRSHRQGCLCSGCGDYGTKVSLSVLCRDADSRAGMTGYSNTAITCIHAPQIFLAWHKFWELRCMAWVEIVHFH